MNFVYISDVFTRVWFLVRIFDTLRECFSLISEICVVGVLVLLLPQAADASQRRSERDEERAPIPRRPEDLPGAPGENRAKP